MLYKTNAVRFIQTCADFSPYHLEIINIMSGGSRLIATNLFFHSSFNNIINVGCTYQRWN